MEALARLEREVGELRDIRDKSQSLADCVGACACGEEYTSRKLRDPDCEYHQMTPEVDELRAALASTGPSQHQAEVARLRAALPDADAVEYRDARALAARGPVTAEALAERW